MLKIDSQNMNFYGSAIINEIVVAQFSATYNGENEVYLNTTITDCNLYNINKNEIDADYIAFSDEVMENVISLKA